MSRDMSKSEIINLKYKPFVRILHHPYVGPNEKGTLWGYMKVTPLMFEKKPNTSSILEVNDKFKEEFRNIFHVGYDFSIEYQFISPKQFKEEREKAYQKMEMFNI